MRKLREARKVTNLLANFRLIGLMSIMFILGAMMGAIPGGGTATRDKSYQALLQSRTDLNAEAEAIYAAVEDESRRLNDDERKRDDAIKAEIKLLNEDIARMEAHRNDQRDLALANSSNANVAQSMEINADQTFHTNPNTPSGGPYPNFGEQAKDMVLAAIGGPAGREAEERLAQVVKFHEQEFKSEGTGAGIAIDSEGGFLVQTTFSREIMRKMHDEGRLLSQVRRIPIDPDSDTIEMPMVDETSRKDGSRQGGFQGYWVSEGTPPTASQTTFAKLVLKTRKVAILSYVTDELMKNASAMSEILTTGFTNEIIFKVEDAIFAGDGAGKPHGFTKANALITIAKENSQAADTVVTENLKKMWARMDVRSRANAVWYINQDVEPALDDLVKTIGTGGIEPNWVTYADAGVLRIKGRPVQVLEYSSTLGDLNDITLADMSQYGLIDQGGIQQAQSLHVKFIEGEMTFKATYSVDGGSLWKEALTPYKGTNTTSPFVNLAARG